MPTFTKLWKWMDASYKERQTCFYKLYVVVSVTCKDETLTYRVTNNYNVIAIAFIDLSSQAVSAIMIFAMVFASAVTFLVVKNTYNSRSLYQ